MMKKLFLINFIIGEENNNIQTFPDETNIKMSTIFDTNLNPDSSANNLFNQQKA